MRTDVTVSTAPTFVQLVLKTDVVGGSVKVEMDAWQEEEEQDPDTVSVETTVTDLQVPVPPPFVQLAVKTDVTGGSVTVVVLEQELITEVGPGIEIVEGEQVPTPPTLVHELIVTILDIVTVLAVVSQLVPVEDPPETPPTLVLLVTPP